MVKTNRSWWASELLIAMTVASFLAGCALIQPPPVPRVPQLSFWQRSGDAACGADIAQAHSALAAAGAAAGDPAATAAAHAAAASAMATYHACLARTSQR